jgi:hypothetical protein
MITRFLDARDRAATRGRFHAVLLGTCTVMAGGLAAVAGMVLLSLVVGTMAEFGIPGSAGTTQQDREEARVLREVRQD